MSTLQTIRTGKHPAPPRLLLYGTEGIGKSTFAAQAPKPIFISTEDGVNEIDCSSFPLARKFADVEQALAALEFEEHSFETVVIDSLDWLEQLIWDQVCIKFKVDNIEKADGGYAKGYNHALNHWRRILEMLQYLRDEKKMVVILIAHAKVEKFEDPDTNPYDRYSPRLHKHAAALVTEWADAVLFAGRKFRTETKDAGFGKTRTIATGVGMDGGERVIRTTGGPTCVAKNRYNLPFELPLSWDTFMAAMSTNPQPSIQENQ